MNNFSIHKTCSLLLVLLFCTFSIGVPILVSACPMMSSMNGSPCCCHHENASKTQAIQSMVHSSCCKAGALAAERNTTEFLLSKEHNDNAVSSVLFIIESPFTSSSLDLCFIQIPNGSPPFVINDIPVHVSSLLL